MATLGDASASAGVLTPMEAEQAPGEVTPKPKRKKSTQNSMLNINEQTRNGPATEDPVFHLHLNRHLSCLSPGLVRWLAPWPMKVYTFTTPALAPGESIIGGTMAKSRLRRLSLKGSLSTKIFEWTGLFKNVKGRKVFVESGAGKDVLRISEAEIDFWDRVRMRWLAKKYGRHYLLDWVPPENFMRTWGHRKCF